MQINWNTFCAAPWFQLRNDNDGTFRACCEIDHSATEYTGQTQYNLREHSIDQWMDSDYNQYLRQNLSQGNRLPECSQCWRKEQNNHRSLRQIINGTVGKNASDMSQTWMSSYFRRKTDWASDLLLSADVKLNNLCNYACAMCSPMDSSQIYAAWRRDQSHPLVRMRLDSDPGYLDRARSVFVDQNNLSLLRQLLDRRPSHIKMLGGEPLMDHAARDLLQTVPVSTAQKINLLFVTNGSQDLVAARDQLRHYRTVSFVVSLEGVGDVQDFVRRGSNWQEIERNIDRYVRQHGTNNIYVHHTVQALSIMGLVDLVQWCSDRAIALGMRVLESPDYLSLSSVPDELRESVIEQLRSLSLTVIPPAQFDSPHVDLAGLTAQIASERFDPSKIEQLKQFLHWYDPDQQWRSVLPSWVNWLELVRPIAE